MSAVWGVANVLGVAPSRPDHLLAASIAAWWTVPLSRRCGHVGPVLSDWLVLHPEPGVWCMKCGLARVHAVGECLYCSEDTDPEVDRVLLFESRRVTLAFYAHEECAQKVGHA